MQLPDNEISCWGVVTALWDDLHISQLNHSEIRMSLQVCDVLDLMIRWILSLEAPADEVHV
jgi:hypothetical protein